MSNLLSEYLNRDQLAAELRVTPRTISRWQAMPDGLPYTTLGGRILYRIPSVQAWISAREQRPNPRRKAAA